MNKRQHDKMVGDVDNMICLGAYNLRVACRPHVTDSVGDKVFDLCDAAMRDALSGKRPKGLVVGETWEKFSERCGDKKWWFGVSFGKIKGPFCCYGAQCDCAQHLCPKLACNQPLKK